MPQRTISLNIVGMHCNSCTSLIKESLLELSGVSNVNVSLWSNKAIITYDDQFVSIEEFKKLIKDVGYEAREDTLKKG